MTTTEILAIIGCLLLGYWIMAVFVPSVMDRETYREGEEAAPLSETEAAWHVVLGVANDATQEEIAAAYKRKIGEYHPDRVAQMGQDIRDVAERKSREINVAFEYAMKLRGPTRGK